MTKTKTKTKTTKTKTTPRGNQTSAAPALPRKAMHQITDWLFDVGQRNADGDREDLATIERVRRAAHATIDGKPCRTTERDLLTVVSLVVTAAERDFGLEGLSDAMATSFDVLSLQDEPVSLAPMHMFPHSRPMRVRVSTLPIATCPHRGPLVAPSVRCVP